MSRGLVKIVCYSELELEIDHYDINNSGGIEWDEFNTIIANDNDEFASETYKEFYFDSYDLDNDGKITYPEIRSFE